MLRKIFIIIGMVGLTVSGFCQKKVPQNLSGFDNDFFHIGYFAGFNSMSFIVKPNEGFLIETKAGPGISVGLTTSFRLAKYLNIMFHPGMSLGQRELIIRDSSRVFTQEPDWNVNLESVYIDLPLHLKYRAMRYGNYAPYILGGIAAKFDIYGGQIKRNRKVTKLLEPFDFSPEIGVGIDFYLYKVKMTSELKFSIGQLNIFTPIMDDEAFRLFDNSIKQLRSRKVSLTFQILGR